MSYQRNFEIDKKKLYERERTFNSFSNIKDKLDNINKQVQRFIELNKNEDNFQLYRKTILFLTSPTIHNIFPTFDERIAFLILVVDPQLNMYKTFLNTSIISNHDIESAEDKDKSTLSLKRQQQIKDFIHSTRNQLGFFDSKLLTYEATYYKKVKNNIRLVSDVRQNFTKIIIEQASQVKDFSSITAEVKKRINSQAEFYLSTAKNPKSTNDLAFNLFIRNPFLQCRDLTELYALFITIIDPDLSLLTIYEEESNLKEMKKRSIESLGIFDKELVRLEKSYHDCFCPNKKISSWSL